MIRLDWVLLGLILWLPVETWILKFVPGGRVLLVLPDIAAVGVSLVVVCSWRQSLTLGKKIFRSWVIAPAVLLAAAACISYLFSDTGVIDAAYWARVVFRFVPLGLIAAHPFWSARVQKGLPGVVAVSLGVQSLAAVSELIIGRPAAAFFWPGVFKLGPIKTAIDSLPTVQDRIVAGTMGHYNTFGWYAILAGSVLLGSVLAANRTMTRPVARLYLALWALSMLLIALSQSRQAFIASLLLLGFAGWYTQRHSGTATRARAWVVSRIASLGVPARRLGLATALVVIVLVVMASAPTLARYAERYGALFDPGYWETAAENRGYAITFVMPRVMEASPWLGMGPGSFGRGFEIDPKSPPYAVAKLNLDLHHARYVADVGLVSMYAQVGIAAPVALAILIGGFVLSIRRRIEDPIIVIPSAACIAMLSFGMLASYPLSYKPTASLLWVLAGLVYARSGAGAQDTSVSNHESDSQAPRQGLQSSEPRPRRIRRQVP